MDIGEGPSISEFLEEITDSHRRTFASVIFEQNLIPVGGLNYYLLRVSELLDNCPIY